MGRRRAGDLDALLGAWAEWTYGSAGLLGTGASMLARLIEGKGEILFGGGGRGASGTRDEMECRIESAVVAMAAENQDRADVLRFEYSAGWWQVCRRRGITDYDPRGTDQLQRALALGIPLRSYERRLSEALKTIREHLKARA